MSDAPPFIREVALRNYKSIGNARVAMRRLMFLVGRNGAGKSNFLDAFRFIADSLRASVDHALRDRGGIGEVRRRSGGHPTHFAIRLIFDLPEGGTGRYAVQVGAREGGGFVVQDELCETWAPGVAGERSFFRVRNGRVADASVAPLPAALPDRLLLVAASGLPQFRPVFDALSRMEVYNLNPHAIAAMQKADPADLLRRDGSNAASVFSRFPEALRRSVGDDLAQIVPGIAAVQHRSFGALETLEFAQRVAGQEHAWRFPAAGMSDGTLRAFGMLLAIAQSQAAAATAPLLVGLEEPEAALHPAAASVLLAALRRAAAGAQILVTSHSPDLLDNPDIDDGSILAVDSEEGRTRIGPIDAAGRRVLGDRLFTLGELLRQDQIEIDTAALRLSERQLDLFAPEAG